MNEPSAADQARRLEREIKRLRHELASAVEALPHLRQMVQHSGDGLLLVGPGATILEANARVAHWLGRIPVQLYGQPLERWLQNPGEARVLEQRLAALGEGAALRMELTLQGAGEAWPLELEAHRLQQLATQPPRWTLALRDLRERRRLETSEAARQVQAALIASLRSSEARYRELVAQLADGLGQLDAGLGLLFANPALLRILAVPEEALLGRRLPEFLAEPARAALEQAWGAVLAGWPRRLELPLLAADGRERQVVLDLQPRREGVGERLCGAVASLMVRDVTQLNAALAELTELAFRDPLTGLANAEAGRRELEARLVAPASTPLLVLWLDLDGFRRVNHSFGRAAGDAVLSAVADRLCRARRAGDVLARPGGDEFLLVRELQDPELAQASLVQQAEAVVQQLRQWLLQPPAGADGTAPMNLGFSAGYSLAPSHGSDAETLLQAAATALSRAREIGAGTALAYEQVFTSALRQDLDLETRLSQALQAGPAGVGPLRLVYQPQVDAAGRLRGAEALLRWHDPEQGAVSPARFVPLAERSGLIHGLGQWVLEEACRQLRQWLNQGLQPPRLAVNLSPRQFELTVPTLQEQLQEALRRHQLPADQLELEITESCVLPTVGASEEVQALAAMGLRLALDDFGTGYSSLTVLHRLALHKLKIDRSFIRDLESSEASRTIVRTALAMGRGLGLETLAEGVETAGQLALLEQLGCALYQGFWFHRPLEPQAFAALLSRATTGQDGAEAAPPHAR